MAGASLLGQLFATCITTLQRTTHSSRKPGLIHVSSDALKGLWIVRHYGSITLVHSSILYHAGEHVLYTTLNTYPVNKENFPTTLYKTFYTFVAIIQDLVGPFNDTHLFSSSLELSVNHSYTTAFESYGKATNFRGFSNGLEDNKL